MKAILYHLLILTICISLSFEQLLIVYAQDTADNVYLPLVTNNGEIKPGDGTQPTDNPPEQPDPDPDPLLDQGELLTAPTLFAPQCTDTSAPLVSLATPDESNAGYTAGQFSVSESGAANYQVSIFTPPGTGGVKPDLSLVFNSQGGNGLLGVGWSVAGLSAIARCPSTLARNGYVGGINFEATDQFCLDGQPLVAEQGGYGADGTTYRTEIDGFARITSKGNLGNGPASFEVATQSGLIMRYGTTADSRFIIAGQPAPLSWAVSQVQDSTGNFFTVDYATSQEAQYPTQIRYTGNAAAGLEPYNAVVFIYEDRPDVTEQYIAGAPLKTIKRLQQVNVDADGEQVREYRLKYNTSTITNRSLLAGITECAGDGTCLQPTQFEWAESSPGFTSPTWETDIPQHMYNGLGSPQDYQTLSGDFNGDGKTDLAAIARGVVEGSGWIENVYIALSTGSGFIDRAWPTDLPQHMWNGLGKTSDYVIIPGDYNGDGLTDLAGVSRAVVEGSGWQEHIYVALSTGDGFITRAWKAALPEHMWNGLGTIQDYQILPGDFNGDGLTDLAGAGRSLGGNGWQEDIFVELSTGQGFSSHRWNASLPEHMWNGGGKTTDYRLLPGDYNGDGLTDIVGVSRAQSADSGWRNNVYVELSTGSNFLSYPWLAGIPEHMYNGGGATINYQVIPADLNGDGRTDLAAVGRAVDDNLNNGWRKYIYVDLSTGTGFLPRPWTADMPQHMYNGNEKTTDFRVVAGDFNSDGYTDFGAIGLVNSIDNGFRKNIYVELGTGSGFIPEKWSAATPEHMANGGGDSLDYQTVIGNFDGQGGTDIATLTRPAGPNGWLDWAAMELSTAQTPVLLTKITNGHGATTTISYKPMTDGTVYAKGSGAQYPQADVQMPALVVADYTQSNGIGGHAAVNYSYSGMRINLRGRGALGFHQIAAVDRQTNITTRTTYHQSFPYTGLVHTTEQRLADGTLLSRTENNVANAETIGGRAYFPYVQQSKTLQYELNGQLVNETITSSEYDQYGNATRVTVQYSDGWSQVTTNTYQNDTSRWFLGRLARAQVTAQAPNAAAQTRTSSFAYNSTTGLLIEEIVEPDNAQLRLVKRYEHDPFGNIVRSTISGTDITTRAQKSQYDARGQFVIRSENALGHAETHAYDARFGSPVRMTGPNGLTTLYEYDSFGRSVVTTSPTGVQAVATHRLCESGNCPPKAVYFVRSEQSGAPPVTAYFDELDRVIRQETVGFDERKIYVDTEYDEHGWVTQTSEPYFASGTIYWNRYSYDTLGRVIAQALPDGSSITTTYNGFTTEVKNSLERTTARTVNSQGQLVKSTDSVGNSIIYRYDSFGNVNTLADPLGNTTTIAYDLRGRKLEMKDPDTDVTRYRYNVLDELLEQQDANGNRIQFTYDLLGRTVKRTEPEGTATWSYDSVAMGIGKVAAVTGADGYREAFAYDNFGRAYQTTYTIPAGDSSSSEEQSYRTCVGYDAYGRVNRITYPTGFAITQQYDGAGYLRTVENAADSTIYWQADAINARGQIEQEQLGNGLTTTRRYSTQLGLLQSIQTGNNGSHGIQNLHYDFDVLGNLTARHDENQNLSETFGYDQLDRLTFWQVSGQPAKTAEYDALGNITQRSDVGTYTYGANGAGPHAVTSISGGPQSNSYRYDANGNRTSHIGGSVEYTSFNKPRRITQGDNSVSFVYGPGRRHYKKITTDGGQSTATFSVGGAFEIDITANLTRYRHYISGGSGVVATYTSQSDGTSQTRYLHRDHIGSLDVITDQNGTMVERLSFDAWGKRRLPNWQDTADFIRSELDRGFTGHEQLDVVGLIHMGGRVYDPVVGRFLSADPFVQAPDSTQSLNRYTYVLNNPLSYTDPSGFFFKAIKNAVKSVVDFVSDNWKTLVVAAVSIAAGYFGGTVLAGAFTSLPKIFGAAVIGGATGGFAGGFAGTIIHGGNLSQALTAGYKTAIVGGLTAGFSNSTLRAFASGVGNYVVSGRNMDAAITGFASGLLFSAIDHVYGNKWDIGRVTLNSTATGLISELSGGKFSDGFKTSLGFSLLTLGNYAMRKTMVAQSKLRSYNSNGKSAGFFGDFFKLAGARRTGPLGNGDICESLMGGCQGAPDLTLGEVGTSFFGEKYAPGSYFDFVNESFAGPHDFLRNLTGSYDDFGNAIAFHGFRHSIDTAMNYALVVPAAPFALSAQVSPDMYSSIEYFAR